MRQRRQYKVCGIYDTETCNYGTGSDTIAYPVLFIVNDIRTVDIAAYKVGDSDDIRFYRHASDMLDYISGLIDWGQAHNITPIITAYNLMFDLQPLMRLLADNWPMQVNAQTATSVYTLDLVTPDGKTVLLRFWDTFYLEQNGLAAMGETCGLPKALGDWDYTLTRTPETPITDLEKHYASRDVQVIPAYLAWLIKANTWLSSDMLGCQVLTKTSLVRQMAKREIGRLRYKTAHGSKRSLINAFMLTCKQEFPRSFQQYALRKACFRGGLTFTAGNLASRVVHNVVSLDVTSMHHTFINGRCIPVHFHPRSVSVVRRACETVRRTSLQQVLRYYYKPFAVAFHARIDFRNLRLKEGSAFKRWGIGLIPEGKFAVKAPAVDLLEDQRAKAAEDNIRLKGWHDRAYNARFAYSKLVSADAATLHVNELEFWNICQVYDFDSYDVRLGETTIKYALAPDYVSLQSNILFQRKQDMKQVLKHYIEGEKYTEEIPDSIPEGIAAELRKGTADTQFLNSYYNSTVKGMFNGIYGTQAMDLMRPAFVVNNGDIIIDPKTACDEHNFNDLKTSKPNVLYTYGMRIVGGSRMHLIIALMLLWQVYGERVQPVGGDTDSIKAATAPDITDDMLAQALEPLADASDRAITFVQRRIRATYPQYASALTNIGHFDIEASTDGGTRWANHLELWNKARISENNGHWHITCAGLSRPRGAYHIEHFCRDLQSAGHTFEQIAPKVLGYDIYISHELCFALQTKRPDIDDVVNQRVTDYLGNTACVHCPQSIALYPVGRYLGETIKRANLENVEYLRAIGTPVDTRGYELYKSGDIIGIRTLDITGEYTTVMETLAHDR